MVCHRRVDRGLVINPVAEKPSDFLIRLIHQRRHLRGILLVAFGHGGGDNLTLVSDANLEFFPSLNLLFSVFLGVPFALAADLQPRAVDDQVNGPL